MKKILALVLTLASVFAVFGCTVAYADFGSGIEVIAEEARIVKSTLYGRKMIFSDVDIKQGLCISDFDSITITALPGSADGTLLLAGRRVQEGAKIKRKNIAALVFIPTSNEVKEASFKFTVAGYADNKEITFVIKFTDKVNSEPTVEGAYADSLSLKTQQTIGVYGKMYATDKEGDELEYIIVSYPKNGTLKLFDNASGEYVYTPTGSYVGEDSFIYVVRDEWGNFSKTQRVTVSVKERMSDVVYRDMKDRREYNAALAMTAMGVMGGEIIGDGVYFNPDETVTRAEFLAMAMRVMGIRCDTTLTTSYFDDDADIPAPLRAYVATAQRIGLITGNFEDGKLTFKPNEKISQIDAAVIISKMLLGDGGDAGDFSTHTGIPVWARECADTVCKAGIFDTDTLYERYSYPVTRAECASYLYNATN